MKLLLVEDNLPDVRIIQEMFKELPQEAIEPVHVDRLAKALEYIHKTPPDMVLLDLGLPDSQGMETAKKILDVCPLIPVIVLTGLDDPAVATEAVRIGAQDFLVKGHITSDNLQRTIRHVSERFRSLQRMTQSEEQFRLAVENAPVPILIHSDDNQILHMSKGWSFYSGYTIEDVPTLADWVKLACPDRVALVNQELAQLKELNDTVHRGERSIRTKDGTKRIWDIQTTPLGHRYQRKRSYLTLAVDVTEQKMAEK